ncbi:hypothetical protein H6794_03130 [Candidatus Nomurabacteria bacterium]|jgi:hypothetical protein|nr:hypothetical protein [Candidatus Saccharibacteria bacterium]MCB9839822.1 hypothetical protein [Candidatus Nomurabacteria bacterium]
MNRIKDINLAWEMALAEKPYRDEIDNLSLEESVKIAMKALRTSIMVSNGGTKEQRGWYRIEHYEEVESSLSPEQDALAKETTVGLINAHNANLLEKALESAWKVELADYRARYAQIQNQAAKQESLAPRPHGPFLDCGDYSVDD